MTKEFKPFVPADSREPEFTWKANVAGVLLSALFGAANAYLAMRAGQTIAATIPAAVIAIALFRLPMLRGGVLEQNITRTSASVGEALVAGAAFTIPAFFLAGIWPDLAAHFWDAVWLMLAGGLLGVFFIIILRRPLCVDSDLPFPEATACAEVVKAGQHGATEAPRFVFGAMGIGALLQFFTNSRGFQLFRENINGFVPLPRVVMPRFESTVVAGEVAHTGAVPYASPLASPALMGIGYIIGPRLAAINFSGTAIAWWLLIPLVLFIDPDLPRRLGAAPGQPIAWDAISFTVWFNIVRPIAVGTMLVAAVYTLYTMRESLLASIRGALSAAKQSSGASGLGRLDMDIPLKWVALSIVALIVPIFVIYYRFTGRWWVAALAALVMTVTGFVLAAIGGYLVGLIGSSNQPVSGLTLTALVVAALLMVGVGVRGSSGVAAVLGVASVVCIACSVAGSLIQDLKAGYLLGGTPWKMQVAEVISVTVLAFFLMWPILALHGTYTIGSRALPAPQAGLMATLASGIVAGQMAWGLVLMGCVFGIALIMIDAPAPMLIAVGMYLPFETTAAIFVGGMLKWLADRIAARRQLSAAAKDVFEQRGTLLASGLIAGEAILAILLSVGFILAQWRKVDNFSFTKLFTGATELPVFTEYGGSLSLIVFAVVAWILVRSPFRKGLPS
ncbi:MAG: oligopeptide transporter, OPT family [Acidobacteria bacterium]|nr:oligopeptide transporter, OPT family [Acidobacteriota bacterium]MBI3664064.1 oligopeptide transporter, OPT family [Acidobacteriota bacterium]